MFVLCMVLIRLYSLTYVHPHTDRTFMCLLPSILDRAALNIINRSNKRDLTYVMFRCRPTKHIYGDVRVELIGHSQRNEGVRFMRCPNCSLVSRLEGLVE